MNEHEGSSPVASGTGRADRAKSPRPSPAPSSGGPPDQDGAIAPVHQRGRSVLALWGCVALVALVGALVLWGIRSHAERDASAHAALQQLHDAVPKVRVVTVKLLPASRRVDLPGDIQPFNSATIFARATGYIKSRSVDIGSKVREGDVMAIISSPDLDQQLAQSVAQLTQTNNARTQALANRTLAGVTQGRTAILADRGYATKAQADTDFANLASNNANVDITAANVEGQTAAVAQLMQLVAYEKVLAPFDGVVTVRAVDIGNLVVANSGTGTPMFSIANTDVLRVQFYVPQEDYFGIKDGQDATVTVPELPGREFHGKVTRNAQALQSGTRTLLTQVDLDNRDGVLTAGLYSVVHLEVFRGAPVALVPPEAVIFDKAGLSACVFEDGVLRLRPLNVLVDDGAMLQAQAGLKEGDRLILNPPLLAFDGMRVAEVSTKPVQPK